MADFVPRNQRDTEDEVMPSRFVFTPAPNSGDIISKVSIEYNSPSDVRQVMSGMVFLLLLQDGRMEPLQLLGTGFSTGGVHPGHLVPEVDGERAVVGGDINLGRGLFSFEPSNFAVFDFVHPTAVVKVVHSDSSQSLPDVGPSGVMPIVEGGVGASDDSSRSVHPETYVPQES